MIPSEINYSSFNLIEAMFLFPWFLYDVLFLFSSCCIYLIDVYWLTKCETLFPYFILAMSTVPHFFWVQWAAVRGAYWSFWWGIIDLKFSIIFRENLLSQRYNTVIKILNVFVVSFKFDTNETFNETCVMNKEFGNVNSSHFYQKSDFPWNCSGRFSLVPFEIV